MDNFLSTLVRSSLSVIIDEGGRVERKEKGKISNGVQFFLFSLKI